MTKTVLRTAISGSYTKFKPEIDACIDEFIELGVEVIEPSKGMLVTTAHTRIVQPAFRPLPMERGLGVRAIQNRFFAALDIVDFHYIYNPEWLHWYQRFYGGQGCFPRTRA